MHIHNASIGEKYHLRKNSHFVYPVGKLMLPHLLRYQGFAVPMQSGRLHPFCLFIPLVFCGGIGGILNFRSFMVVVMMTSSSENVNIKQNKKG